MAVSEGEDIVQTQRGADSSASDKDDRLRIAPDDRQQTYVNPTFPYLTLKAAMMGLVVSLGGLVFGYDTGQISGFLAMDEFKRHFGQLNPQNGQYYFSTVRSGVIVGILNVGNFFGALLAAPIADRAGRKLPISCFCLIYAIGAIVQVSSDYKWYQIVLGRFTGGLGVGALSILVPLYTSETSPTHNRGMIVCGYQLFVTVGIFIAYAINYGTEKLRSTAAWRITICMDFIWALLLGCGLLFFPESPKYAYRSGNIDEARRTMSSLLGVPENHQVVSKELGEMKSTLEAEQASGDGRWWEAFTGPRMAYRNLLGIAIFSFQQLTGANFFFYYGTTVFAAAGVSNSYLTQIIIGTVNVACTFPGLYFVQHFSHRKCLILGGLWMSMCFVVFASVGHFALDRVDPTRTPTAGVVMIVFTCLFIAAFASTWGPMSWGESAALYPVHYRATCMAVATGANWIWNFLISFLTPFITAAIDYRYGYVFAACCLAMAATIYFFLIESRKRTLEKLDTMYVSRVPPWKSGDWDSAES